ncbi:phosphatase PAP2 family protein [Christiangramia salexigens]|uniref:Phosphatase PAP2 family protein n=1 Tax=Christiangramia salexigens TaxID=1913577 RepID=A0A1L3J4U0_9FLAO|nr:phosphatase PAP2 family protein [Christiangramia salexigens]APG60145.1 phosphatase PAP2 family protein [Christiangramia salexigens]
MEKLANLDRELFLFLNNLGMERWDWLWVAISDKWMAIPLYAVLLYLLFRTYGWKATLITLVVITLLITATDQLANVFKHGFERLRPCRQEGVMEYARFVAVRCGSYGYFSAHAANSTGVAIFLGFLFKKHYPKLFGFLIIWALVVSYSRIYLGVHYPGDVITGIFIGAGFGYLFYSIRQILVKRILGEVQ